jgi:hypothetical protein
MKKHTIAQQKIALADASASADPSGEGIWQCWSGKP